MNPMIHLGTAHVPGGVEIRLYRRGDEFMILLPKDELMSSRMRNSEERLATMTLERLAGNPAPRMLIGGYGMGFTLRAALVQPDLDPAGDVRGAEMDHGVHNARTPSPAKGRGL